MRLRYRMLNVRSQLHRRLFQASNGRVMKRWGGLPVLMLTTTDRHGGTRRTILVTPLREDDRLLVVASNGGAARDPVWFRNLKANPDVEVLFAGQRRAMRARKATATEKERFWPLITSRAESYARYQARTAREIPVVVLEPRKEG